MINMLFVIKDDKTKLKFTFGTDIDKEVKWEHFRLHLSVGDIVTLHNMLTTNLSNIQCRIEAPTFKQITSYISVQNLFKKFGFKSITSLNTSIFTKYKYGYLIPMPLGNHTKNDIYSHVLIEIFSLYCYEYFKFKYYAINKDLFEFGSNKKITDKKVYDKIRDLNDTCCFKACQIGKILSDYLGLNHYQANVMFYTSYDGGDE